MLKNCERAAGSGEPTSATHKKEVSMPALKKSAISQVSTATAQRRQAQHYPGPRDSLPAHERAACQHAALYLVKRTASHPPPQLHFSPSLLTSTSSSFTDTQAALLHRKATLCSVLRVCSVSQAQGEMVARMGVHVEVGVELLSAGCRMRVSRLLRYGTCTGGLLSSPACSSSCMRSRKQSCTQALQHQL